MAKCSHNLRGEGQAEGNKETDGRNEKEGGERIWEVGEGNPRLAGFNMQVLSEALTAGVECDDNVAPRRMQRFS